MAIEVVIEVFSESDLPALQLLFSSYFTAEDKLLNYGYNKWLYGENPFGKALMVRVLEDTKWIGFMALIPVRLVKSNNFLSAYYVVNVLVHPDYQGRNLFGRMIKAAMNYVEGEDSILIGHPNALAIKTWQRANMHFHEPLRPSFALSIPFSLNADVWEITSQSALEPFQESLNEVMSRSRLWKVAATSEYLNWRFLCHPTCKYRLQGIGQDGEKFGVQISKGLKLGMSMLIDQFVYEDSIKFCSGRLPFGTICFSPSSATSLGKFGKWAIPLKKRVPFFMTRPSDPFESDAVRLMGLSASDF